MIWSYNWGFFLSYLSLPLWQLSRYSALQGRWVKPGTRHHCPAWNFRACFWSSWEEMKMWKQSVLWENILWHLKGSCRSQRIGFKHRIIKNTRWAKARILDTCPPAQIQRRERSASRGEKNQRRWDCGLSGSLIWSPGAVLFRAVGQKGAAAWLKPFLQISDRHKKTLIRRECCLPSRV